MKLDAQGRGAFVEGNYRYWLTRNWGNSSNRVTFVGLNPSTADAMQDDPTIRKCIGFAKRFRFGSLLMLNLFAFRATDPKQLALTTDPVGDREHFWNGFAQVKRGEIVICSWGAKEVQGYLSWPAKVMHVLAERGAMTRAIQLNRNGSPKHPLYAAYSRQLVHFRGVDYGGMK